MNKTDIAAYLGAAAWAQSIFWFVYKFATKPLVTIIPAKTIEIGYTTWGPIIFLRFSINADIKDALIDSIRMEIRHEKGSKHIFEWTGSNEFFSEIKNSKGENQIIQRDIIPIAVKISTLSPVERLIRFQESDFIKDYPAKEERLIEKLQYLKMQKENYLDDFFKSEEFNNYLKYMKQNFFWQAGNYTLKFNVSSPRKLKLEKSHFKFELKQDSIDMLKKNINELKNEIEYNISSQEIQSRVGQPTKWFRIYTLLSKIK